MPVYVSQSLRKDLSQISDDLLGTVMDATEKFKLLNEQQWSARPAQGKWSKKEVLGHLIDSAANNHIRFLKAQLADKEFKGLSYEQEFFVASQQYQERSAAELIELWSAYNRHIAHVIKHVNSAKLDVVCTIGGSKPESLLFIIEDYVGHLKHHLKQILA